MNSQGILEGLKKPNVPTQNEKMLNTKEVKNLCDLGLTVKRSFNLMPKTVKMLLELKIQHENSLDITLSEIVNDAILSYYEAKSIK